MIEPSVRLRRAIRMKDAVLVKRVIQAHPNCLENPDYDDSSNTSLHLAAELGLTDIARLLLDAGHDANETSRNVRWETPLMIAAQHGHVEVGTLLIDRCGKSITLTDKRGLNALSLASSRPTSTPLIPLLISHPTNPASISTRDNQGNTALHHASANGSLKALRLLLEAGADPDATNAQQWTPLAYSQTVQAEVYFKQLIAEFDSIARAVAESKATARAASSAGMERLTTATAAETTAAPRSAISPMGHSALPLPPMHLERLASAPSPSSPTSGSGGGAPPLTRSLTAEAADAMAMPPPPPRPLNMAAGGRQRAASGGAAAGMGVLGRGAFVDAGKRRPVPGAVRLVTAVDDEGRNTGAGAAQEGTWSPLGRRAGGTGTPTQSRAGGYFDGTRMRAGSGD